jgi:hypothetical protein
LAEALTFVLMDALAIGCEDGGAAHGWGFFEGFGGGL